MSKKNYYQEDPRLYLMLHSDDPSITQTVAPLHRNFLQVLKAWPFNEDHQYEPIYPFMPARTWGYGYMIAGAISGFVTKLGTNAITKQPLWKGEIISRSFATLRNI
jgi:hypothetical protein